MFGANVEMFVDPSPYMMTNDKLPPMLRKSTKSPPVKARIKPRATVAKKKVARKQKRVSHARPASMAPQGKPLQPWNKNVKNMPHIGHWNVGLNTRKNAYKENPRAIPGWALKHNAVYALSNRVNGRLTQADLRNALALLNFKYKLTSGVNTESSYDLARLGVNQVRAAQEYVKLYPNSYATPVLRQYLNNIAVESYNSASRGVMESGLGLLAATVLGVAGGAILDSVVGLGEIAGEVAGEGMVAGEELGEEADEEEMNALVNDIDEGGEFNQDYADMDDDPDEGELWANAEPAWGWPNPDIPLTAGGATGWFPMSAKRINGIY